MSTLSDLERRARAAVDAVKNDPTERFAFRKKFYERWGKGPGVGLGSSELAFMQWEIDRGVLDTPALGGSPWWRAVNEQILFDGELATLVIDELPACDPGFLSVRQWIAFMRSEAKNDWPWQWYRAHNASIVTGYDAYADLARLEPKSEKIFVNMVLYRLLFAQALVEGDALGRLGRILANPAMPSVEALLEVPDFYPRTYPLTRAELKDILGDGHSLPADILDDALDDFLLIPELEPLYLHCSGWLGLRCLDLMLDTGRPSYPDGAPGKIPDESPHPPIGAGPKRKVAIFGGGLGSLAAAYELTSYDGWKDRYDITLYQLGWRLGGKTASGWGPAGRIEERGIHIFQGWYNNAFRMVQDAFSCMQTNGLNTNSPLQDWDDAFFPDDATLFTQLDPKTSAWTNWPVLFPYNDKIPGVSGDPPPVGEILAEAIGLLAELVLGSPFAEPKGGCLSAIFSRAIIRRFFTPPWETARPGWWNDLREGAEKAHPAHEEREEVQWLKHAAAIMKDMGAQPMLRLGSVEVSALRAGTELFGVFVAFLRFLDQETGQRDERLDHIAILAEYGLANLRGVLADVYDEKTHTFDFSRINSHDYREWLLSHGLPKNLEGSAPVRFIYCGAFHNQYQGAPGRLAADMAVRSLLVSVTYRGTLVWRMVGGTGGSLIGPVYKLLRHRGVKFEFFHDIQEIAWSDTSEIEEVRVAVQVDLREGLTEYDPLEPVKGLDAFPSAPKYAELDPEQAKRLIEGKIDLESPWSAWAPVRVLTLKNGVDFDDVIHGIPVRATERICAALIEKSDKWKNLPKVRSTPTFGVQLWLRPTLQELGLDNPRWGLEDGAYPNSVIYDDLFYSWTDTSCVIPCEGWKADRTPGELSYYCGTWPIPGGPAPYTDHGFPEREKQRLVAYTKTWIGENMGWFFPHAVKGNAFDLTLLVHPEDAANERAIGGDERLAAQWFAVNVAPSDEYTLAWPGTDQYRIKPGDTGFTNLYVAGDWTSFGLNIGHMEGAVTSGLVAAQALLSRYPHGELRPIFRDIGE